MLLAFLHASQIHKVGVKVSGDLKRLFRDCGFVEEQDKPFQGATELGKMAKEQGVASTANIGLADLCATVIKHFLTKEADIRVSSSWDMNPLPQSHISYAALDVYATWLVFKALMSSGPTVGKSVDASTPGRTTVSLFSADGSRIVAYGQILPDRPSKSKGINVTKTRVLIVVNTIVVPGHLVSSDLLPGNEDLPLSVFSPTPFQLLCKAKTPSDLYIAHGHSAGNAIGGGSESQPSHNCYSITSSSSATYSIPGT